MENNTVYIHNGVSLFAGKWIELDIIMLNEIAGLKERLS